MGNPAGFPENGNWKPYQRRLVKTRPLDYRRVLAEKKEKKEQAAKTVAMVRYHG